MSDDLVQFLRARLDEDEAAQSDDQSSWHEGSCASVPSRWRSDLAPCDCAVPQRVLADVAAKRRVVETCDHTISYEDHGLWLAQQTLELLALAYAAHPDYRPEWAPDAS